MLKRTSLRLGIIAVAVICMLLGVAACTRSKSGPLPTPMKTGTVVVQNVIPVGTITGTVVAVETATLVPTMTPQGTPAVAATPTPVPPAGSTPTPVPTSAANPTATPVAAGEFEYTVQPGDTLWGLAREYGMTVEAIKQRNKLTGDTIYPGSKLILAGSASAGETITHTVQPGENLFRISLKYGLDYGDVARLNGIVNPGMIQVGQKLIIRKSGGTSSGGGRYHAVQPGETLTGIALKYNTTPWAIAEYNKITNTHLIYAGQVLRIP